MILTIIHYGQCQAWSTDACEAMTAEIYEELGAYIICLYLFNRKNGFNSNFMHDFDEIIDIGLLGHLQDNLSGEIQGMRENWRKLWIH